jgi:galactosylceramidase
LFKPNFGAALHILKVEIGGDAQSTDGAEASHMHNPWDENYDRGYEWWLMVEAKKRNPDIKLYGLSWAFPQWVTCTPGTLSNCSGNDPYPYPEQLATYITKWVAGAKNTYGLDIDFIGSWNERAYNIPYLKVLRSTLDASGFNNTLIVAPDSGWSIAKDILADPELAASVHGIGAHYPGMYSSSDAEATGKPLWASEDDSTYDNDVGAECWARIINRNFVLGNMTATINWNLVTAYMKGTQWYRAGLFNAMKPWTGNYGSQRHDGSFTVGPMVWAAAHTTQFSKPGWSYLPVGQGSGMLSAGGSYVTLADFTAGGPAPAAVTMVIEKMSSEHSSCVRPHLAPYPTADEEATFQLAGHLKGSVTTLNVWYTHFAYHAGDATVEFEQLAPIAVAADGTFSLKVTVDSMYTLTTVATGAKGSFPDAVPAPTLFPPVWADDFEACPISSEAAYWADQNGVWECRPSGDPAHGTVMQQMVPLRPVTWGGDIRPHSLIGHRDTFDASFNIDAYITEPAGSILLGVHMAGTDNSAGTLLLVNASGAWGVYKQISDVNGAGKALATGQAPMAIGAGAWHTLRFDVNDTVINVWVDGAPLIVSWNASANGLGASGHFLMGTGEYGHFTQFDNVALYSTFRGCPGSAVPAAGSPVVLSSCLGEVGAHPNTAWTHNAAPGQWNGTMALTANPSLCLTSAPQDAAGTSWLVLAACDATDPKQIWTWKFEGIAPDRERASQISNSVGCIDQYLQLSDIGMPVDAYSCNGQTNQAFFYDWDEQTM